MRWMRKVVPAVVGPALLFAAPVTGEEEKAGGGAIDLRQSEQVYWISGAESLDRLPTEIERLYVSLYNTRSLPVTLYGGDRSRTVGKILADEGLLVGNYLPVGIDAVLCDLNPYVCSRALVASDKAASGSAGHVGGYRKSKGAWSNDAEKPLYVPDLFFDLIVDFKPTVKPEGMAATELVAGLEPYCEAKFKRGCMTLVETLNEHDPAAIEEGGKAYPILPYLRAAALIPIAGTLHGEPIGVKPYSDKRLTPAWRQTLSARGPVDLNLNALGWNIVAPIAVSTDSHGEPHSVDQSELLDLIAHPFRDGGPRPEALTEEVTVGVADFGLDEDHCDLVGNVRVPLRIEPPGEGIDDDEETGNGTGRLARRGRSAADCGETSIWNGRFSDHGAHVVGIIAAKDNGVGITGLNPYARVNFHQIDQSSLNNAVRADVTVRSMLGSVHDTDVVNLSWEFPAPDWGRDPFLNLLKNPLRGKLVVAAAGNKALRVDEGAACGVMPACYKGLENLITVVGLDRNPTRPEIWWHSAGAGSNFGVRFHIAAVAEDVFSTVSNGYVAPYSGTSQAAPQVTAAASLLYSTHEWLFRDDGPPLQPRWVKNRLMYTADLFRHLIPSVFSGRLNVERALAVNQDIAEIAVTGDDSNRREIRGSVLHFGLRGGSDFEACAEGDADACDPVDIIRCKHAADPSGGNVDIPISHIRRMKRFDEDRRYFILYTETDRKDSKLLRITDCDLLSRSQSVVMENHHDGNVEIFELRQIRDYVASMY